ncbi:hypothetical protein [Algoriphagus antarcticus]|uniref:DUF4168 domain-containing protein n=1 Tax=Algoriphagus antarcticus TaxID=238540 RepID=A0A3E0DWA7_9BACT|nr:hypothetical protein [Algoriphagus antarcticus]REG90338.1 hypothetical protein C8N25_10777 [Algoriphagus antarcticus]
MKKVLLFGALFAFLGLAAYAQDEEKVTDEDLAKYANVEVTFDNYVNSKTEELKSMILENEIFQGGGRYNEIKAAWDDEAKMTEAKVTEEEKVAYEEVKEFQASLQGVLKEYKTGLIVDEEILGAGTYNKVLKATNDDPTIKEKLDNMIAEMKAKQAAEKADTTKVTDGK